MKRIKTIKNNLGMTLIELMIVVAIVAILLGIGLPSLQQFIQNSTRNSLTNDMVAALLYGRSEAGAQVRNVSVCSTTDFATCTNTANWENGYIVVDSDGTVLRAFNSASQGYTIRSTVAGNEAEFGQDGRPITAPVLVRVCDPSATIDGGNVVIMNAAGQVRSQGMRDYNNQTGSALACP